MIHICSNVFMVTSTVLVLALSATAVCYLFIVVCERYKKYKQEIYFNGCQLNRLKVFQDNHFMEIRKDIEGDMERLSKVDNTAVQTSLTHMKKAIKLLREVEMAERKMK